VWRLVGALYASPQRCSVTMWDDVRKGVVVCHLCLPGCAARRREEGGEGWSCRDCVCRAAQCLLRSFLVLVRENELVRARVGGRACG